MKTFVTLLAVAVISTSTSTASAVILSYFDLGLNTFEAEIGSSFNLTRAVRDQQQIDWIELVFSNHEDGVQVGGAPGITDIRTRIYNGEPGDRDIEIDFSVAGDGFFSILDKPFTITEDRIFFDVRHTGDTINASTDIELNVFVSQAPEPTAAAILTVGGALTLSLRRASRSQVGRSTAS